MTSLVNHNQAGENKRKNEGKTWERKAPKRPNKLILVDLSFFPAKICVIMLELVPRLPSPFEEDSAFGAVLCIALAEL